MSKAREFLNKLGIFEADKGTPIKACTSCGHKLTTKNAKYIGDQELPDHPSFKGKKMKLYNCPKCDSTVAHMTKDKEK